jgi:signal transduction histidine kinase
VVGVILTTIYTLILYQIPNTSYAVVLHIFIFIFALLLMVGYVYIGAKKVAKELKVVENYLDSVYKDNIEENHANFFTQEFDAINRQLINILRKIKKKDKKKRKQNAKIKLKNRQRSNMLSTIAHEFRNPIASIMGYAQTLNEDEDIPPHLRRKFLTKVYNNGEKIEELLSRLLLWNRFESGEQELQLSKFDIQPIIMDVVSNLKDKYKNRTVKVDNTSLKIKADKALMEIVMKNLIENALKYSKEEVEVKIEGNKISVIDKGIGISIKNLEKVTKKFFRTNEHLWDNSMGLGLAIVKQILKLHNSAIIIDSKEHVGSIFYFYI